MRHRVVALLGATASGKTAVAVEVARRLPVEVVSADSRQLRCEMSIGTAAPTDEELAEVPHHLVGILPPDAPWTVADFQERARAALEEIWRRGRTPLLVGGSGQYVWALLEGWNVPRVPPDGQLRERLGAEAAEHGAEAVHGRLAALDPDSAWRIDARNVRRVVRALEIVTATGAPVAPLEREPPDFDWCAIGIAWPREALYRRADERVERMYAAGLVAETASLVESHGTAFDALKSIGYAEAARVVGGEWDERTAVEHTKAQTHRLIRTQATWFRADDARIEWCDGSDPDAVARAVVAAAAGPVRSPDDG